MQEDAVERNAFGQPVGFSVKAWNGCALPPRTAMGGRYCSVEVLETRHAADLFAAYAEAPDASDWTYLMPEPFADLSVYTAYVRQQIETNDPLHHAIIDSVTGKAAGTAALMRIDSGNGAIEVGHIHYSPRLKHCRAGTEAMYLLMRRVFEELRYRRYEWKCDSLNGPSRRAAERYGFRYEGIFRQAVVYKGRNRDTAWYAIIDKEWPRIRAAFESWLSPENFDDNGTQRRSLRDLREADVV